MNISVKFGANGEPGRRALAQGSSQMQTRPRMLYIDNLRLGMIVLVVLVHLNVTYGQIGSWYYVEQRSLDTISTVLFAAFGSFTQAYFMGLLFFLAGLFVPGAYDRKGARRFISDRLFRLGVPTLVYVFILNPIMGLIMAAYGGQLPDSLSSAYLHYLTSLEFLNGSGPLWFALALLLFSLIYAGVRAALPSSHARTAQSAPLSHAHTTAPSAPFSHASMIKAVLLIAVASFAVRLAQPIGTAVYNMQLCFFPQYVFLFVLGLSACQTNLLDRLTYRFGMVWWKLAVIAGTLFWVAILLLGGALENIEPFYGGWHWQAFAYALWESFFCVGFIAGLLVWFRERGNVQNRLVGFLSANAFGVYVFHAPILLSVTVALRELTFHPMLKIGLAALIVLPLCFACAHVIRAVPAFKKVFS